MKKTTYLSAALLVIAALVIAGCGGGGSSSSSSGSSGEEASGGEATIAGSQVSGLGSVLVDSSGVTVYEFTEDEGTTSACYGGCEAAWPPVVASGKPTAGEGAQATDLGTAKRKDGTVQVTYKGHLLYTFSGDKGPGEANGNEDDGTWFVLDEAGTAVEGKASGASESSDGDDDGDKTSTESSEGSSTEASQESSGGSAGY